MQLPVGERPVPSQVPVSEAERPADVKRQTLCLGMWGAAALILAVVGVGGVRRAIKRRRHRHRLAPDEQGIIKQLVAHGERKRWDFSYDETFLFDFLPLLKKLVR